MSTRYTVLGTLASGGMGTVFLARMAGSAGFSRLVAIKRLHPELAAQKEFVAMLVDEARLASSLHHANIVDTLDLVATDGAFGLVLEYIEGAALAVLARDAAKAGEEIPRPIIVALAHGILRGLDAAHEARSPEGTPLGIVHRDISPQNVLVGTDGVPRIIDFGIAKALGRVVETRPGEVRGKFAYMAPEQLLERPATRQADVYAAGVVLWELLTGTRLFTGDDQRAVCAAVLRGEIPPPSSVKPDIPKALDDLVRKATARETSDRYLTAREMLDDLATLERASDDDVGRWVRATAAVSLARRAELVQAQQPEHSRSVEDLLAELAASAPPKGPAPAEPVPPLPSPSLPVDPPSARGLTNAGLVVPGAATTASRLGPLVAIAVGFLVVAGGLVALGVGRRSDPPATTTTTAPPPPPSETASAEALAEEPIVVPTDPSASPASSSSASPARAGRKPPRARPPTRKSADPAARDFDHP